MCRPVGGLQWATRSASSQLQTPRALALERMKERRERIVLNAGHGPGATLGL